ncbi:MAG: tRNA lysidine(34) synthetase TilS [Dethiobacteria bacterium]|jgi:tRNA(Ile)-lysidine synthase
MVNNSVVPFLHERLKKLILRERLIEKGDLIIVAVSGGVDSLSLLHIFNTLREEEFFSFSLFVAHLNHGLRGKSAREDAEFVRCEAQKMGLPCTVAAVDSYTYARRRGLSLEDAARRLRYRFLQQLAKKTGASRIAVGHNREDQVETLMLNFLRGTGLAGLAGMKMKRIIGAEGCHLIRPLLETSREELERYCREKGLSPRWDETNRETHFLRNKIRLELLPFLEKEYNPNLRQNMQRLARLVFLDNDFLEETAARHLKSLTLIEEDRRLELDGRALLAEHEALQGRILRLAVCRLLGTTPREVGYNHIRAILNLVRKGSPHGRLHLPFGLEVSRSYDRLKISFRKKARSRFLVPFSLTVPGKKALPGKGVFLQAELLPPEKVVWPPDSRREAYLDYDRVLELFPDKFKPVEQNTPIELWVRGRRAGDRFHPLGAPGKRKLKKYFIDQKIPLQERDQIPLVLAGEEIIWVVGMQPAHFCRITEETERVLVLRLSRRQPGATAADR